MNRDAYAIRLGRAGDLPRLAEVERSAAFTCFEALGAPFEGNGQVVPVEGASPGLQRIFSDKIVGGFDPARRILMTKPLAALQPSAAPLYPERI
ncbi:MAG TPA: hypothetical protein VEZ16_07310 [Microvirga sp.]|nr:hypothetical protein [Microvirga sp.]